MLPQKATGATQTLVSTVNHIQALATVCGMATFRTRILPLELSSQVTRPRLLKLTALSASSRHFLSMSYSPCMLSVFADVVCMRYCAVGTFSDTQLCAAVCVCVWCVWCVCVCVVRVVCVCVCIYNS